MTLDIHANRHIKWQSELNITTEFIVTESVQKLIFDQNRFLLQPQAPQWHQSVTHFCKTYCDKN